MRLFDYDKLSRLLAESQVDVLLASSQPNVGYLADLVWYLSISPYFLSSTIQNLAENRAKRLGEGYMGDNAPAKKGVYPAPGAVNKLVRDNQVAGLYFLFEATRRVTGNDVLHPQRL